MDIPGKLLDEAEAQLLSFFQNQMFTRERLIENDMVQYDFFRETEDNERVNVKRITFLKSTADSLLWELYQKTGVNLTLTECLSADTVRSYFQYTLPGAFYDGTNDNTALIKELHPAKFSELLPLLGFSHATIKRQEEIKIHILTCPQSINDYDFFSEDIYDRVCYYLKKKGILDDTLARETTAKARAGIFLRFGVDEATKNCFNSLDIPDSYIDYLERIRYVFPRGHMLAILLRNIRLSWFYQNKPSAWADIPVAVNYVK